MSFDKLPNFAKLHFLSFEMELVLALFSYKIAIRIQNASTIHLNFHWNILFQVLVILTEM